MSRKPVNFSIHRFRPAVDEAPHFEEFTLAPREQTTVLAALEEIRSTRDPSLMYRRSCHHASCGTCAVRINGEERLACATRIAELGTHRVTIEPLKGFQRLGDLVIDPARVYADIPSQWTYLKAAGRMAPGSDPRKKAAWSRFEDCIECGACVSACPVSHEMPAFMGPAALAALNAELGKNKANRKELLSRAASPRGAAGCRRALRCSRVCPTNVAPARQIMQLKKKLVIADPAKTKPARCGR